ncbi:MAG: copper resistance CopC/CopD family protein [Pseudoclavibacter sp.]
MTATLRKAWLWAAGLVITLALLLLPVETASAHAYLVESSPSNGSSVDVQPEEVVVTLSEAFTLASSSGAVSVLDEHGERVDEGLEQVVGDGTELRIPLPSGLPDGVYLVNWSIVAADSHVMGGSIQFGLGVPATLVDAAAEPTGSAVLSAGLGLLKALLYAGLVLAVGVPLTARVLAVPGERLRRLDRVASVAAAALTVVSLSQLLVQFAWIRSALDRVPPEIADVFVFLGGTYAFAIWLRLIVLAALWLLLSSASRGSGRPMTTSRDGRLVWGGILLTGFVAAASTAMTGHGGVDLLRLVPATVHGFAAIFWLGGLAVLVFAVATRRLEESTVSALGRWTLLAGISVALLVLTGIVQSVWQVGYLGATWSTPYGRVLLFKLALVVVALLAALAAWLWTRRRAAQDAGRPQPGQTRRFRRRVSLEATAGLAILVVSGLLSSMTPAASDYRPVVQGTTHLGAYDVDVAIENSRVGSQTVRLLVEGTSSEVPLPERVTARLSSAEAGVASIEVEFPFRSTLPVGPDVAIPVQYQSLPVNVPLDGTWELEIQVVESERREHVARVAYEVVP